jgi:hypothetical protein
MASVVNAVGWLCGGVGIGTLALALVVVLRGPTESPSNHASPVTVPASRPVTVIEVKPPAEEASDAVPSDLELPDETPAPRVAATKPLPKRRPLAVRTSPY